MNKHTVTLEIAKELKDFGWTKKTLFSYVGNEIWDLTMQSDYETPSTVSRDKWLPAPIASELLEELPLAIDIDGERHWVVMDRDAMAGKYHTSYGNIIGWNKVSENVCDSLALMWIFLKENNLINKHGKKEINK